MPGQVLDSDQIARQKLRHRAQLSETLARRDRVVVALGGRPSGAEPALEVVGAEAVIVHQQVIDEARAVGVRGHRAAPGYAALAVLVVGVREVEPIDEVLGGDDVGVGG